MGVGVMGRGCEGVGELVVGEWGSRGVGREAAREGGLGH